MRIVVWNCQTALHQKVAPLKALRPDLAIIPECAEPDILRRKAPDLAFTDCDWWGRTKHKGLGVFAFGGLSLRRHESWETNLQIYLPIEVRGGTKLNLLAVWAFERTARGHRAVANPRSTMPALGRYSPFLRSRCALVAGDFNAHVRWDKGTRSFSAVNEALRGLGLASAYHAHRKIALGAEPDPTLFLRRDPKLPYHVDYIYAPEAQVPSIRELWVGSPGEWLPHSDHMPIVLDLDL